MAKRDGIDRYRNSAFWWSTVGGFLQASNVILGVLATALTITVAGKPFGPAWAYYNILGWVAAIATAALTFVRAEERGRAWSKAGRHLEDAIGRYDIEPTYTFDSVAKAREEAVKLSGEHDGR